MSSGKRRRDAEAQKAVQLEDAQKRLSQLLSELAKREKLDQEIRDLDSVLVRHTLDIGNRLTRRYEERDAEREKALYRQREKVESLLEQKWRIIEGIAVETIVFQIEEVKSQIEALSVPTYIDRIVSGGAPSTVEKEGLYNVQSQSEGPLYECCFPAYAQPPLPLSLAHGVFGDFLDDFSNVSAQLDNDVCNFVVELCFDVLGRVQVFQNEIEFQGAFNQKMEGFLGHAVAVDVRTCGGRTVTTDSTVRVGNKWTALGELKLERGATLALGLQSFAIYVGSLHAETELLPCFSIEVIGPTMRIGGLVFFEKVAWQPLTPFMNCFYTDHDRTDMATLCRAMCALKKGLTALGSYYKEKKARPLVNTITPKDIPYRLQGRQSVRVGKKLIFIVICDDGEPRIFKYCRQYGEEVHRSWAKAGCAPLLYNCEPIAGGWLEVEMQYLADWSPSSSLLKDMDEAARCELQVAKALALERASSILIDGCRVAHGDMRPPNVMVKRDDGGGFDIKFVDFDWAGKVGVARYPLFMNTEVPWHPEVGPGKFLQQVHDTWWLADKPGVISPSTYHLSSKG